MLEGILGKFWHRSKVQAVSHLKWHKAHAAVDRVVICDFCKWQDVRPLILLVIYVATDVLLQHTIHTFTGSISRGVVQGAEPLGGLQQLQDLLLELRCKLYPPTNLKLFSLGPHGAYTRVVQIISPEFVQMES